MLMNQIQAADLQEAVGITIHPSLAGYRGDPKAQKMPMKMRLDYELTNLINLGVDERAATLALDSNMKHNSGAGTDARLISIYNLLPADPSGTAEPATVGLRKYQTSQPNRVTAGQRAKDAVHKWKEHFGAQNNNVVRIENWYLNLLSAVRMLKESGEVACQSMWILNSLAYLLYLMTQTNYANQLPKNMADRLKLICLNRTRPASAPRVTIEERVRQLREHHKNFMEYSAEDAIMLWGILRGEAVTVNEKEDLIRDRQRKQQHWFSLDFFQIALKIARQEMQMPLWMCGKIQLDDWILITEEQHIQI